MSKMKLLKTLCLTYLNSFASKDSRAIGNLLSDDVVLTDWELSLKGKCEVLSVLEKLFDSVTTIDVEPIRVFEDVNTVIIEMNIKFDEENIINVVDIVRFNSSSEIESIVAYRQ
jgi:hypothetical protein